MLRAISLSIVILLTILFSVGPSVHAQKAKKDKMDGDANGETKNTDKLVKSGIIVGKVMNVYEDKRRLRIQVSIPTTKINPGAGTQIAQAQQQMLQAQLAMRNARDPNSSLQARQQLMQANAQMMKAQAQMYQTEMVSQELEVQAIDDVIVRLANPKEEFDEKGRIKKYSKAELKELRGDGKLPGYKAEFSDIQGEQVVRVTTVRKKGEPTMTKTAPTPKKKKGKDDEDPPAVDGLADKLLQVSLIEILREAPLNK